MDKVQKHDSSKYNTLSSEPFTTDICGFCLRSHVTAAAQTLHFVFVPWRSVWWQGFENCADFIAIYFTEIKNEDRETSIGVTAVSDWQVKFTCFKQGIQYYE
jgi:hypothetical protein